MPALPPAPQVLRFDLAHSWDEDPHLTSRFFSKYTGGAPSPSDCVNFATNVATVWAAQLAPLATTLVHLIGVTCTDLTSGSASAGSVTVSHAGTRSGQNLTINDCAVLNFQIARRYRGGKPRMYGPWGVAGDLADSNTWGGAFIAAVEAAWNTFYADLDTTFGTTVRGGQVNVSYYEGFASVQNPVTKRWRNIPTPRTGNAVVDNIQSNSCSKFVGSQRRRVRA